MKFIRGLFGFAALTIAAAAVAQSANTPECDTRGRALDDGELTDKQRHRVQNCLRFVQAAPDQAEQSTDNSGWTRSAKRIIAAPRNSPT